MDTSLAAPLLALALAAPPAVEPTPAPAATEAAAVETPPRQPREPGRLRRLAGDFKRTLATEESLWILGVGGAAALLVSPWDDEIQASRFNSELHPGTTLDAVFEGGHYAGGAVVQIGGALGVLGVGKLSGSKGVSELGGELVRAQIVSGSITQLLKLTTRRERPDGSSRLSFPSGHASSAFATATVFQRRYGPKIGVPAYAVAAWIAASRLNENRHFLSDVTFGAAVGIAAGRAVSAGRGSRQVTIAPQIAPGGGAGFQVTVTGRP